MRQNFNNFVHVVQKILKLKELKYTWDTYVCSYTKMYKIMKFYSLNS